MQRRGLIERVDCATDSRGALRDHLHAPPPEPSSVVATNQMLD